MTDRLNLIETIAKQDKFSTFAKLMASSGATDVFLGPSGFTVFVPTNEAFAKIPTIIMNELLSEPDQTQLKSLLSYHILPIKVMAGSLGAMPTRNSATGEELRFSDSNGLKVNGATIQSRNIEATNGVIHSLDTVLAPSTTTTPASVAVAAAAASTQMPAVPATVPSVTGSVTGTAIPTELGSSAAASVPTTPSAAAARADTKPIF
ncbi:MAG: fasciclin domain-containing protein [Acidobacteriota bacterium]